MIFRLRGGREIELRSLAPRDLSGVLTLERSLAVDGTGMVRVPEDIPEDESALRGELAGWLGPRRNPDDGRYIVAAALTGGTVPILGSAEIRRLGPRRVRHVGVLALAVHPSVRRQGLGRALLEDLLAWADARLHRSELYVRADNHPALELYRSLGFVEEGRRRDFVRAEDGHYVDDLVMGRLRSST